MKQLLVFFLLFSSLLFADNNMQQNKKELTKEERAKKNLEDQVKREEKYAREQKFYSAKNYDFKGAEVDEETVNAIPDKPNTNEDFDMDSTYD